MIVKDCYSSSAEMALWRVDITNDAQGKSASEQQALPNNTRLLKYADGQHVSTVAIGDWAFISTEDGTDTFNSGTVPWHAYRQEIIALNVITGEVRRLAHHRSRSVDAEYRSQPRVSAGWSGKVVGFASNFNQPGGGTPVVDIFAIPFPLSSGGGATTQDVVWTAIVQAVAGGSSLSKTPPCDCSGGAVSHQQITSGDGYVEFTVGEMGTFWIAGLSHGNPGVDGVMDFAIRFNGSNVDILEKNSAGQWEYKAGDALYAPNDVFRVAVVAGQVQYTQNGAPLARDASIQLPPTYPLLLDASLRSDGATINNAVISGNLSP